MTHCIRLQKVDGWCGYQMVGAYVRAFAEMNKNRLGYVLVEFDYKYDFEQEWYYTKELVHVGTDGLCWENDWDEGQTDIRLRGMEYVSDLLVPNNILDIRKYVEEKVKE